ncbi:hypothetical protein BJV77DRAFT_985212, partial [Russula vinacea]
PPPVYGNNYPRARSPSPLRSSFKVDPNTGEVESEDGSDNPNDDDLDPTWGRRSQSPNPSISQFASSFAQRVGSFVNSVGTSVVSSSLPTDEEIEREAERDRERSRREAEQILIQEAEERRLMEEKVLAMLQPTHITPKQISPARSQSMPSFEIPSPTPSQRENGNRLTPTKEPLTAAQQVIQEAKEKEKREKKEAKKDRKRSSDWPAVPENKYTNPTLLSLVTPPKPSKGALAPSPLRTPDSRNPSPSRSPSREPPPLYTQFTDQGSLDVPGTLLVIARRFEKLEKWTDVERWLVEKEGEKGADGGEGTSKVDESSPLEENVNQMRDELMEMQGRIGELGREMAKFATSPGILSTMPSRVSAQAVSTAPQTNSSFAIHAQTSSSITVHSHSLPPNTPQASVSRISSYSDLRRRDSQPRSRSVVVAQGALSPPQSPPTSNSASASPAGVGAVRPRPVSVAGIPAPSPEPPASAPAGLPPSQSSVMLVAPPQQSTRARSSSISPTPRKRYTVALGEPIMKPRMSVSPPPISVDDDDDDESGANDAEEEDTVDRTIGRSAGRYAAAQPRREQRSNGVGVGLGFGFSIGNGNGEDTDTSVDSAPRSRPPRPRPHTRTGRTPSSAQSMVNASVNANANANATATGGRMSSQRLLGHGRALSIDRAGALPRTRVRSSTSLTPSTPSTPLSASAASSSSRFRDPLVARAKAARPPPKVVAGKPRAPVGEMVAYFDKS